MALALLFAFAVVSVSSIRFAGSAEGTPPVRLLTLVALQLIALSAAALYLMIRTRLGLAWRTLWLAIGFNALVIAIKFVLSPKAVYDTNRRADFSFHLDRFNGALLASTIVFVLYFLVLWGLYRYHVGRYRDRDTDPASQPPSRRVLKRALLVGLVVAAFAVSTGGIALLVAYLLMANGLQYLKFVFSSGLSLLVALALAGATSLAAIAFQSVREQATVLRDAALIASFFWIALSMITAYHVLWVVYIVALASVWPLRVVVPK